MDDLTGYDTVATWLAALPPAPSVRKRHLEALARWCAAEGADPDALVAHGRESRDAKNDAMRRLRTWVETQADNERDRHDLQNAVRSFYITNGLRVLTKPYADVYRRPPVETGG